ncbi:MAG: thioesterase family protein [Desulfosudaceae bacterium]
MTQFDNDIALSAGPAGTFGAEISPRWSINDNPDGGYLMALLAEAVRIRSDKPWPAIITANFIARCRPGPAEIKTSRLGSSRSFERWQAELLQEGQAKIRVLGTMIDRQAEAEKRYELPPPEMAAREKCFSFPGFPAYTLFEQMDVRLDPDCAGCLSGGALAEKSEFRGWISFREERDFDPAAILLAADSFPPPVLASHGMVAWVPTIEMSVNIRNMPQSRWLKAVFRSSFINNGIVEEDGQLWDETGELIAISRQIAHYRRNQ